MLKINQEYVNRLEGYGRRDFEEILQEELILCKADKERIAKNKISQIVLEINASGYYVLLADFMLWSKSDYQTIKIYTYGDETVCAVALKHFLENGTETINFESSIEDDKETIVEELKRKLL